MSTIYGSKPCGEGLDRGREAAGCAGPSGLGENRNEAVRREDRCGERGGDRNSDRGSCGCGKRGKGCGGRNNGCGIAVGVVLGFLLGRGCGRKPGRGCGC